MEDFDPTQFEIHERHEGKWNPFKDQVIDEFNSGIITIVTYAVHTCWWNTDYPPYNVDLSTVKVQLPGGSVPMDIGPPCDPRGSVCMEAHDVLDFLRHAEETVGSGHYGPYRLRAFMLALHGCVTIGGKPTSFKGWQFYNELLKANGAKLPRASEE